MDRTIDAKGKTEIFRSWVMEQVVETLEMGSVDVTKPFVFQLKIDHTRKETNVEQVFKNKK